MLSRVLNPLRLRAAVLVAALVIAPVCAVFAEAKVRGTLSTSTAAVGEAVQYELVIEGAEAPENPPVPQVDGLEVRGTSRSSQLSIMSTRVIRRVTIIYTLVPTREGKFTIPPLEVQVDGRKLVTTTQTLTVTPGEPMNAVGDLAFGKIWLEKKNAYLGEVVPLELRLYLDAGARWDLRNAPALSGGGFTTQPLGKPTQRDVELAGKTYHLVTFRTVITPGKAGRVAIGPVPFNLLVSKRGRSQPQFLLFGPQFDPAQQLTVNIPALEMQVKPLPAEGRPKDFAGAIGKFQFSAVGTPERVNIGEPVGMKLTIQGRGNFDRIGQPPLVQPDGWTTYSAKEQFLPSDGLGTEGVKTFELPVTPIAKQTAMPVFAFSFFDVETEKYVTLKSAAAPLQVDGEPAVALRPAPAAEVAKPEPPKAEPKPAAPGDIL
ncbi:MAG: BatD family protein, partial [Chthoniobacteraceae bacterium]